ncbi:conserved hypothetical protein [Gloeothece citriformis PCC 7424]|uniref:Lipopolysaccharide biosynthesis protein n=1 Tax=Gloeothece citriformis (strain PCC 7424) TaxID=65393 RepID=B7KAI3_GLOC7|nr:hypothetical protein [Gloeothece citriformis]ACK72957.1 conserved hypothetical protein [Gloeothece citriformis PCC 7424]
MTESLRIPHSSSRKKFNWGSWKNYLLLTVIFNTALWSLSLTYKRVAEPVYASDWSVTLPGLGSTTAVQLPNIGQTSTQIQSPFNNYFEPRETYKYIALSRPVLLAAANQVGLSLKEFGKPDIKIVDNTTLISFNVEGTSPEEAQNKAIALYQAFEKRLQELRLQEAGLQNSQLESELDSARRKLQDAQQKLSRYKARSGFSSFEQITQLSTNIEQLRRERAVILAQKQQSETNFNELSTTLSFSTQQATEAFTLQSDPSFQELLTDYGESNTALVNLNSRYTPNHPAVIDEQARLDFIQNALLSRAQSLLKKSVSLSYIEGLSVNNSQPRQQLTQELISTKVEKQGLASRAQEIERQTVALEQKLKELAKHQLVVEDLQRDVKIAEAVFSSTITKLDLGKTQNFGSYPPTQMISEPSLSSNPAWPNPTLILIGTIGGSFLITSGLFLLGLRDHLSRSNSQKINQSLA